MPVFFSRSTTCRGDVPCGDVAPLRLLAAELYDTLNNLGTKTTLLTGEEVIDVPNATHYSSTLQLLLRRNLDGLRCFHLTPELVFPKIFI